jgi:hypothetical protein
VRASRLFCHILVRLTLACSSGVPESTPTSDTHVSQAEAGAFCDAFDVMERKCLRCHGDPTANGAPFRLDSYEATQVPARDGNTVRSDRMREVIESGFMPPVKLAVDPPVEPLSCAERATLLAWLENGAPPPPDGDPQCEDAVPALKACDDSGP